MDEFVLTSNTTLPGEAEPVSLELLLQRIEKGDMDALSSLYSRTHAAVYGFALSILKKSCDAEDVLQETYLRVFSGAESYRPSGKPMAWLLTIARNLSLMRLRAGSKEAPMPEDWELAGPSPAITSEDRLLLRAVMQLLPREERQIVILHAVAGFKHRETATLLQLPLSTVLSKYHRAMKKLKLRLTEGEIK